MTTHKCPTPGCTKEIPAHQLACTRDWFRLPVELRNRINKAWHGGDRDAHSIALREALRWYQENAQ